MLTKRLIACFDVVNGRVTKAQHFRGVSLLHVSIATGRTHQIRVHLRSIGHPIVGDALYGGVRRHVPASLRAVNRLERPFLHAWRLAFRHPEDGRRLLEEQPVAGVSLAHIGEFVDRGLWLEQSGRRLPLEPRGYVHAMD